MEHQNYPSDVMKQIRGAPTASTSSPTGNVIHSSIAASETIYNRLNILVSRIHDVANTVMGLPESPVLTVPPDKSSAATLQEAHFRIEDAVNRLSSAIDRFF